MAEYIACELILSDIKTCETLRQRLSVFVVSLALAASTSTEYSYNQVRGSDVTIGRSACGLHEASFLEVYVYTCYTYNTYNIYSISSRGVDSNVDV
jgi:hypothetical protein